MTLFPKNSCETGIRVNSDRSQSFCYALITMEDGWLSCPIKVLNSLNLFLYCTWIRQCLRQSALIKILSIKRWEGKSCLTVPSLSCHLLLLQLIKMLSRPWLNFCPQWCIAGPRHTKRHRDQNQDQTHLIVHQFLQARCHPLQAAMTLFQPITILL